MAANSEEAGTAPVQEEHIDACPCGTGIDAAAATPDDQLPAASGGVAAAPLPAANEDDIDKCDATTSITDFTTDDELPAAAGGVL
jgi:hypothetical protein